VRTQPVLSFVLAALDSDFHARVGLGVREPEARRPLFGRRLGAC